MILLLKEDTSFYDETKKFVIPASVANGLAYYFLLNDFYFINPKGGR